MKFNYIIKKKSSAYYDVLVTIPSDTISVEKKHIKKKYLNKININGFRNGKVPEQILMFHYGKQIWDDIRKNLIKKTFDIIKTIGQLKPINVSLIMDVLKHTTNFKYRALIEEIPILSLLVPFDKVFVINNYILSKTSTMLNSENICKKNTFFYEILKDCIKTNSFIKLSYNSYNVKIQDAFKSLSKKNEIIIVNNIERRAIIGNEKLNIALNDFVNVSIKLLNRFLIQKFKTREILIKIYICIIKHKKTSLNNKLLYKLSCISTDTFKKKTLNLLNIEMDLIKRNYTYNRIINAIYKMTKLFFSKNLVQRHFQYLFKRYFLSLNLINKNNILIHNTKYIKDKIIPKAIHQTKEFLIIYSILKNCNNKNIFGSLFNNSQNNLNYVVLKKKIIRFFSIQNIYLHKYTNICKEQNIIKLLSLF